MYSKNRILKLEQGDLDKLIDAYADMDEAYYEKDYTKIFDIWSMVKTKICLNLDCSFPCILCPFNPKTPISQKDFEKILREAYILH